MVPGGVEIEKIDDGAMPQSIYRVTDRTTDDQTERHRKKPVFRTAQPKSQKHGNDSREPGERRLNPGRVAAEHAETDAAVSDKDEIEEPCNFQNPRWIHNLRQNDPFAELVEHGEDGRANQAETEQI